MGPYFNDLGDIILLVGFLDELDFEVVTVSLDVSLGDLLVWVILLRDSLGYDIMLSYETFRRSCTLF